MWKILQLFYLIDLLSIIEKYFYNYDTISQLYIISSSCDDIHITRCRDRWGLSITSVFPLFQFILNLVYLHVQWHQLEYHQQL